MGEKLSGKRVAILAADGFEQVELTKPRTALNEAGATTTVISFESGTIQGMNHSDKGDTVPVDQILTKAKPEEFDALADYGQKLGFEHVASGPLVRSSYHADQMAHAAGYVDAEVA